MDQKAMKEISEPCGRREHGGIWSLYLEFALI